MIGGTGEAVTLTTALATEQIPCLVTVTTEAARRAYGETPGLRVRVGALAVDRLASFIQEQGIGAILDASHPFAVEISQAAIATAQALGLPYWRYERPAVESVAEPDVADSTPLRLGELIRYMPSLDHVLNEEILAGERVLLTLGYRWLDQFRPWQDKATLFARILPSAVALAAALAAGFTPDRLIALRPPVTAALELALWQQWTITTVITKASGQAGGEGVKRAVAQELGIPLVIISRPRLEYPAVSHSLETILATCRGWGCAQTSPNKFSGQRIINPLE